MLTKLIQAATITFVFHLLMGLSVSEATQTTPVAIGQTSMPEALSLQLPSLPSGEL